MFLGEMLCLLVFKLIWFSTARYRIEKLTYKGDPSSCMVQCWPINVKKDTRLLDGEQVFNPLIFWIASICDMLSTCLSYFALNLTTASTFQMLRGSVMVFTAILRWENFSYDFLFIDHCNEIQTTIFFSVFFSWENVWQFYNGVALSRSSLV